MPGSRETVREEHMSPPNVRPWAVACTNPACNEWQEQSPHRPRRLGMGGGRYFSRRVRRNLKTPNRLPRPTAWVAVPATTPGMDRPVEEGFAAVQFRGP